MLRRAPGPLVFDVRTAAAVGSAPRPRAAAAPRRGRRESPLRSMRSRPRPARPRGASPGRASCGAASPLPSARRRPGARRRRGSASSSGRPWRPWSVQICGWQAPLLCAAVPGLPPPVGLPPQRGRGSHECPASTNSRRLAARLSGRALFALPPSALGAPCNDDGSRHRDPLEPVLLRAVPTRAVGRTIVVTRAIAQTPSTRPNNKRDRHEDDLLIES